MGPPSVPAPVTVAGALPSGRVRAGAWAVLLVLGAMQAAATRHAINGDGVSYIEIAQAYLAGSFASAVNGYWSPLYSWLLAATFAVARPARSAELATAHALNFVVFVVALASFELLLGSLARGWRGHRLTTPAVIVAYAAFGWCTLALVGLGLVTPDLCVATSVFAAAALLARTHGGGTARDGAALGLVLALGYLAKAAMFPLGAVFLGVALLVVARRHGVAVAARRGVVMALAFAAIAGPWIVVLSRHQHRATFGDVGKLTYSWFVTGDGQIRHWQGGTGGTPVHPTRQIAAAPAAFEFATPIAGSYPPWYDPTYWNEGLRVHPSVGEQLRVLAKSARWFKGFAVRRAAVLLCALAALVLLTGHARATLRHLAGYWFLLVPAVAGPAMYALVLVEPRYIAPFVTLATVAVCAATSATIADARWSPPRRRLATVMAGATAAATFVVGPGDLRLVRQVRALAERDVGNPFGVVADELRASGIAPGSAVAVVGGAAIDAAWAHLAGVRIVAQVPSAGAFWAARAERQAATLDALARTGAAAVVAVSPPPSGTPGWRRVGATDYFVRRLGAPAGTSAQP